MKIGKIIGIGRMMVNIGREEVKQSGTDTLLNSIIQDVGGHSPLVRKRHSSGYPCNSIRLLRENLLTSNLLLRNAIPDGFSRVYRLLQRG